MIKFIAAGGLVVLAFAAMILLVHTRTAQMKEYLDREIARKDLELRDRLIRERKAVYKNLSEKYGAEKASYQATAERLESEKRKVEEELLNFKYREEKFVLLNEESGRPSVRDGWPERL